MTITESQLETWSRQGSVTQSSQTYKMIKKVLNDTTSPYYSKDFSIFLQGSYGNDTNVFRDSDVDIVVRLNQTYHADITALTPDAKAKHQNAFRRATYQYADFHADVLAWLQRRFGADVRSGKKAISIKGRGNRRDADVLVCVDHRRYLPSSTCVDAIYERGIMFKLSNGTTIINFPRQHSVNCTAKHENTNQRFKRIVRVYKNMRNSMIDDDYIADGVAPSYFIEGLLWNVPEEKFSMSYKESFFKSFMWVVNANREKLVCANSLNWLVRDNSPISWSTTNFFQYLAAAEKYWNEWSA